MNRTAFTVGFVTALLLVALSIVALSWGAPPTDLPHSVEHIRPAYVLPQQQASALAVPDPKTAPPTGVVVVTNCHSIVGIVVSDSEGSLHPMNLEGLSNPQVSKLIDKIPQKLVVDTGCTAEPDRQPIF